MGIKTDEEKQQKYLPKDFKYEVTDRNDPKGNEYVNVPNLNDWRKNSPDTFQFNNKWNPEHFE